MRSDGAQTPDHHARAGPSRLPLAQARATPPASPARDAGRMIDAHGRTVRDLRISITDRCNFRCVYCMEPDVTFAPRESLLSREEIVRIARVAESLGVRKIRITGGEPTLHPELLAIIAGIRAATGVELAMITNGSRMTRDFARACRDAGLSRVTISIDTLDPARFASITRSAVSPSAVLGAVEACLTEGLVPLKLNAVLIRGENDDEAAALAGLARAYGIEMRFIEYMPLDAARGWNAAKFVPASETRGAIERVFPLVGCGDDDPSGTARTFAFADGAPGRVGFIAPVSEPFCGACSRLRITADAKVRPCLFSRDEWDLRALLDAGADDASLRELLLDATWTKQAGHGISAPAFQQPPRTMSAIGG